MSIEANESEILITFARAGAKAQEIERILKDSLIAYDVDKDTQNRSFEEIARRIDKMPLIASERIFQNNREGHARSRIQRNVLHRQ